MEHGDLHFRQVHDISNTARDKGNAVNVKVCMHEALETDWQESTLTLLLHIKYPMLVGACANCAISSETTGHCTLVSRQAKETAMIASLPHYLETQCF